VLLQLRDADMQPMAASGDTSPVGSREAPPAPRPASVNELSGAADAAPELAPPSARKLSPKEEAEVRAIAAQAAASAAAASEAAEAATNE
jgi:hypothetical protein